MLPQDLPTPIQQTLDALNGADAIAWIDWTAMVLLGVFFILGLFKGFLWQISRILSLVAAWFLAGYYGPDGAELIGGWFAPGTSPQELPLFLSYVMIFVAAVVVLSIIAWLLQKLVKQTGMTFYDRLGGAVLGLGTGACGVLLILAGVQMFLQPESGIVASAQNSQSMQIGQKALRLFGDVIPQPVQRIFDIGDPEEPPK